MKFYLAAAAALTLIVAPAAHADLLQNGGFETGDLTGWSCTNCNFTSAATSGFDGYSTHSGNFFAALGNVGSDGELSQTVSDTAGQTLQLTYYLAADGGTPSDFSALWNGVAIAGSALVNSAASGYVKYVFDVLATGSDTLTLLERNDPSYWALDDVSLNAVGVPEPGSLLLLSSGLLAAAGFMLRRKSSKG